MLPLRPSPSAIMMMTQASVSASAAAARRATIQGAAAGGARRAGVRVASSATTTSAYRASGNTNKNRAPQPMWRTTKSPPLPQRPPVVGPAPCSWRSFRTVAASAATRRSLTTLRDTNSVTTNANPSNAVVALVAGGASGLGWAAAKALLQRGAHVVVADKKDDPGDAFAAFLASDPVYADAVRGEDKTSRLHHCRVDVTNPDQVAVALDLAELAFGRPVNVAVCCAGIASARRILGKSGQVHSLDEFKRVLEVNAVGTFNVARLSAERMVKGAAAATTADDADADASNNCIIMTSSIAAYDGQIGQVAYAASKAAVAGMTLPLARDLAIHKIRVVTIAPGLFETPLLDGLPDSVKDELGKSPPYPQRLGRPAEFGQLVCSILDNPYLNGEVIRLDGALRMPP